MDDFYKRLYDAKEEHQLEFTKLSSKLLSNRIRFLVDRLDDYSFVEYENLMSTVSGKLSQAQKIDETQKSVKVLRFYQIISQNIGFLEGKPEFMQRIFDSAFLEHITDVKELYMNWKYDTTYEDLMKQVNSQMVKLEDFPYFLIKLDKIFYVKSEWAEFPENLSRHIWKIKKIIYKSLKLSMIENIKYFYSESNKFFGKWRKRNIRFYPDTDNLRTITIILFHCSFSDNCDTYETKNALDNVLERTFAKNPKRLLKLSPIDLEFVLKEIREGMEIPEMEELIQKALFSKSYRNYYF